MQGGTVVARNNHDGIVILSSDARGGPTVEWGAKNDINGDDFQFIPEAVLNTPAFQRAVVRGLIEIVDEQSDPEVVKALNRQVAAFRRRQEGAKSEAAELIDRPDDRASISLFCVGPDSRGIGECGESVIMRVGGKDQRDAEPPLCSQHKHLRLQFVPDHRLEGDGKRIVWTRVTIGSRERELV